MWWPKDLPEEISSWAATYRCAIAPRITLWRLGQPGKNRLWCTRLALGSRMQLVGIPLRYGSLEAEKEKRLLPTLP